MLNHACIRKGEKVRLEIVDDWRSGPPGRGDYAGRVVKPLLEFGYVARVHGLGGEVGCDL